ncbi:OB-fold nucleic acid binding domain-containing protein [uncultured Maritimibacter sp.]|uniref:OB-fold nucleic acid binding domain-containing protein n=1 Tax=uncultured Maritimibacter sp. TaxID=991866 RepID=UPI002593BDBA|nr:OB-fold nucleic acid binding domain-containing protein [uncultured Maritimibacter sp.]
MNVMRKLAAALGLALLMANGAVAETVAPRDAVENVGFTVTVEGVVSQVSISRKGTVYINFGGWYPNHVFQGVIFNDDARNFSNVRDLEGQTVTIRGRIKMYNGKPEIIVDSPSQIQVR